MGVRVEELVGKRVVVRNPYCDSEWVGMLTSYSPDPAILVDTDDGNRVMLKAAWATPVENDAR